jgi:hypothetical protein
LIRALFKIAQQVAESPRLIFSLEVQGQGSPSALSRWYLRDNASCRDRSAS